MYLVYNNCARCEPLRPRAVRRIPVIFAISVATIVFVALPELNRAFSVHHHNIPLSQAVLHPTIAVKNGDHVYYKEDSTLEVTHIQDQEFVYFICQAPYPIHWVVDHDVNQSGSSNLNLVSSLHLSVARSFTDFYNLSSYVFTISSRVRVRSDNGHGLRKFRFSCGAVEKVDEPCLQYAVSIVLDKDRGYFTLKVVDDKTASLMKGESEICKSTMHSGTMHGEPVPVDSECESFIYYKKQEDKDNHDRVHSLLQGPKYSFMCSYPSGRPGFIKMLRHCSSAVFCNNLYVHTRLPKKCFKALDSNTSQVECHSCSEKIVRLFSGFMGCVSNTSDHEKPDSQMFLFSSIPQNKSASANIHFNMEPGVEENMLSISEVPGKNFIGEQIFVACNMSNYYFAKGTRFALKYKNSNELVFIKSVGVNVQDSIHNNGYGVEEVNIPVNSSSLERVYCFAPVWNSFLWLNKSRAINIEDAEQDSTHFEIFKAVALTVCVAVVIFASLFAFFWLRVVNKKNAFTLLSIQEIQDFRRGNVTRQGNTQNLYEEVYAQTAYDQSYEIGRDRLLLDETAVLGRGHFGLVIKGVLTDEKTHTNNVEVAVKTIKTKMDVASLKALLSELKIMAAIGKNPHVVNLLGACTKKMAKGEVFVAVEFCHNGNLQNFLRKHRQDFDNQVVNDCLVIELPIEGRSSVSSTVDRNGTVERQVISTLDLVKWSWEIAKGMEFLSSKKVIHGDLATRNILLTAEKMAKVGDFGLSRQLVDYYYVKKESGPMPWKWMAIESLRDMKFSIQSDVWSYAITLWEIFSLAEVPYPGCSWSAEFVITLLSGHRMGKPSFATTEIYDLMRECWNNEPADRPSFFAVKLFFEDILAQSSNQDYMQIACYPEMPLEEGFQKLPLLRITEALSPEEDEVFE